jgi:hypothetical protein
MCQSCSQSVFQHISVTTTALRAAVFRSKLSAGLSVKTGEMRSAFSADLRQNSRRVVHGEHVNLITSHEPVDDAIRRVDDFAHVRIVKFRHCPARLRKLSEPSGCRNQTSHNYRGLVRRILFDEGVNRVENGLRLLGPENDSHDEKRRLTSSCGTSWRASDWRRPSSIFAMKQSRSIASSIVASSGRPWIASIAFCFSVAGIPTILPSSPSTSIDSRRAGGGYV